MTFAKWIPGKESAETIMKKLNNNTIVTGVVPAPPVALPAATSTPAPTPVPPPLATVTPGTKADVADAVAPLV